MKTWKRAFKDAVIVGSFASLTSLAVLALRSRSENGSAWASVNAPSHWLWGQAALTQDRASLRYTATGFVIHHLSAGFWGVLHEKLLGEAGRRQSAPTLLRNAALTSAVAAVVDFALVPQRLSPGFQRRLSSPSLTLVYTLFAVGLAAGSYLTGRRNSP